MLQSLKKTLLVVLASAAFVNLAHADNTGLVGKTFTPTLVPPNTDISMSEFGNGYFVCGGSIGPSQTLGFAFLRKGKKASCEKGTKVIALYRPVRGNGEKHVLDVLEIKARPGQIDSVNCKGADVVISKVKDTEFFTDHVAAWRVVNDKFVPATDFKKIKCLNEGWGI